MPLAAGVRLGPYEIVAPIGAGGMGEVYRARDTRLDRTVAIKVLPPALAADPELRGRFEREARAVSSLQHPHICALFDIGEAPLPEPTAPGEATALRFLVLEHLEGETLAGRLARTGALPLADALKIAAEICDALDRAHRSGIVHRDLKPANVMLTRSGAKLLDFGLAKAAGPVIAASGLSMLPTTPPNVTAQGAILGTFQYMAPEQLEGLEADARTDLFAFGALVFEMIVGRPPFEGKTRASLLGAILKDDPPRLSELRPAAPAALDRIVATCLAKDPDDRYQSARDLLRDLRWASSDRSELAKSAPVRGGTSKRAWIVAMAALVALAAVSTVALRHVRESPEPADSIQFTIAPPASTTFGTAPGGGTGATPQLAVSPNGRLVAFVANGKDGYRIWVRSMDVLDPRPIAGTENAAFPFWSPDSRQIGFFAGGKLKKVAVAGGPPVVLCDAVAGRGGTWNRENVIVFSPSTNGPLQRVAAAGGAPQPASTLDAAYGESSHRFPWFLPDGRHFLFSGVVGTCCPAAKQGRIRIGALGSSEVTTLATADSAAVYASGHVLFQRDNTLLATPFDIEALRLSGEAFPVAEQVGAEGSRYVSFSASVGGTLAYARGTSRAAGRLTWLDRRGRMLGTLGEPATYMSLALSNDERHVAVAIGTFNVENRDIWIVDVATGTPTRFTFGAGTANAPLWTADDKAIVYQANRGGVPGIYMKRVAGTTPEEKILAPPAGTIAAYTPTAWSNDSRYLIYSRAQSTSGSTDVWALPLTGERKPFAVVESPVTESNAVLSPDGKWLAYQVTEGAQVEAYVQPFPPTGGKFQVSTNGGYNPAWSRDGKELFFTSVDGRLMSAAVNTHGPFLSTAPMPLLPLATALAQGAVGTQYAVTRDGRFLVNVIEQQVAVSPLNVVVNWLTVAK
jgi:serine/threonine protein kinase/Tol biopolymer transport system component